MDDEWEVANSRLFSRWGEKRVHDMARRHEPAIIFFLDHMRETHPDILHGKHEGKTFSILDVGCGGGHLLMALVKKHPSILNHARLTGIDIAPSMIGMAQRVKGELFKELEVSLNQDALAFKYQNLLELKREECQYDIIVSLESIYYVSDMDQGLSLIHERLEDGGTFIIMNEDGMMKTGNKMLDQKRLIELKGEIDVKYFHFLSLQQYKNKLQETGFQDVCVKAGKGFHFIIAKKES
ncbi:methyltransferase domain-containing protein [Candidatus Bathyarchaeota archaeon]|nr:methyltransferase domain-containing protein [Candidatus Bathyarchaeota archaeon]